MKSINNYIVEKLKITKDNGSAINIDDMLEIFHQVMRMNYKNADKAFIAALEEFCNYVTSLEKIEIHMDTLNQNDNSMYKVERNGNTIKIYKDGITNCDELVNKLYKGKGKVRDIDFNIEYNPIDEMLDINDEAKMFYYSSMEGGFIFVA